ncbi:hypothetical protein CKO44_06205 [Rubrivivax gelatinosus]|uniref:DUF1173 family protein n=1 Tax=Rubrivivax gelatinosus TaxID=28068 RepID=UPI001908FB1E|nr:hypothetical protein [Rubrivivax gelatinosus]
MTRWHTRIACKPHRGIVRRHLLPAARQVRTPAGAVVELLYVPEVFSFEHADQILTGRQDTVGNAGDRAWIRRAAAVTKPQLLAQQPPASTSQASSNPSTSGGGPAAPLRATAGAG